MRGKKQKLYPDVYWASQFSWVDNSRRPQYHANAVLNLADKLNGMLVHAVLFLTPLSDKTLKNKNTVVVQKSQPTLLAKLWFVCSQSHLGFPFVQLDTNSLDFYFLPFVFRCFLEIIKI